MRGRDRRRLRGGDALKPVLFVTNHVPPDRAGAFAALADRVPLRLVLFGGPSQHATEGVDNLDVPHEQVTERDVRALAGSHEHSFVVAGTVGRRALPGAYAGARRSGTPFVLWSALWHQPRSPAHLAAAPLVRHIHTTAHAVVTYGPHVTAFARRLGARRVHVAPQAVDGRFWERGDVTPDRRAPFQVLFAGRDVAGKGVDVLLAAWARAGLGDAALVLAGVDADRAHRADGRETHAVGVLAPEQIRNLMGGSDVVVIPSTRTATFREPWGLVANEAMHLALPVIASTEVGAAAGGLVRHARNGLIVPAGDAGALAGALRELAADGTLRARLGLAARRDVQPFSHDAWAAGLAEALH
ncbi:MAG TPA: glycosyltransferase family 4 protein [Solirubrobacteraceae bacterium]|nr:glycosyltransferase family 4 protein [Solirubrobacteraceae bacterium]